MVRVRVRVSRVRARVRVTAGLASRVNSISLHSNTVHRH